MQSLFPTSRGCPAPSQEAGSVEAQPWYTYKLLWKINILTTNTCTTQPSPLQYSQFLLLSIKSHDTDYPFDKFQSIVLFVSYPNLLSTPSLPAFEKEVGGTVLMLCNHCSANAKTLVHYQAYSSNKCKSQYCVGCCEQG